jgi:DNA repair photolyase
MNEVTKDSNMYQWVDYTTSPIKGCEHDCSYCYLRAIPNFNFEPRFSEKELNCRREPGATFFFGSAADMWGKWVPSEWIQRVLNTCDDMFAIYVFQSKNPERFHEFQSQFNRSFMLGTTIESDIYYADSKAPPVYQRAYELSQLHENIKRFVTIEPVMDFNMDIMLNLVLGTEPDFVNIGCDSKGHGLVEPPGRKVKELICRLEQKTEVRIKPNLRRILGGD